MTRAEFEKLVSSALRKLPRPCREKMANIAVVVEDWADEETLADVGIEPPDTLYGLYRGVDLTHRDSFYGNVLPAVVPLSPPPPPRPLRSLFAPRATRVVRVLLADPTRAWRLEELAKAAEVSLGHSHNVVKRIRGRG